MINFFKPWYFFLFFLLAVALGFGLFLPLMENDSAQHATMAWRMARENDFAHIFKGKQPYLDKPHLHFWLSGLSFEIFGKAEWAYRLPAILLTLISGYGVFSLSKLMYQKTEIGQLAALFYLTSQTILLSLHDVRTDAVLTSMLVLAIWQWAKFLEKNNLSAALLGGIFTACAYSTKGLVAVALVGLFLFIRVAYQKNWEKLLNYKVALGILAFFIFSLPIFLTYYHQFGWEGVKFIAMGQSAERFQGGEFGQAGSQDYFFYFHTLLWAFLPWSLWFYLLTFRVGFIDKKKRLKEIATLSTALIFIMVMNFSQFKLPHYINPIVPLMSIFTAAQILNLNQSENQKFFKAFKISSYIILLLGMLLLASMASYFFPIRKREILILFLILMGLSFFIFIQIKNQLYRLIFGLAAFILLANIYLNSTFYKNLIENYQADTQIAKFVERENLTQENIFVYDRLHSWALDWSLDRTTPTMEENELKLQQKPYYLVISDENLHQIEHLQHSVVFTANEFRVTRLSFKFINPKTRASQVNQFFLVKIF